MCCCLWLGTHLCNYRDIQGGPISNFPWKKNWPRHPISLPEDGFLTCTEARQWNRITQCHDACT
jgi:hypothetical protein